MAEKPNSMYRRLPAGGENVGANTARDVGKVGKAMTSSASGAAREATREAAGRAASRLAGRAGAAGAALSAGWDVGRAIDERTGVGRKMVDKALGPAKYDGDRVELSSDSKARLNDSDYGHEASHSKASPARRVGTTGEWRQPQSSVREGGNSNISDDTRERARRWLEDKE